MSRVGQTFGRLTVTEELPTAFRCTCECGRVGLYNKNITKPSYKKRLQCEVCAGWPCEVCGNWINSSAGRQSPTCSVACRKARAIKIESERYSRVKETPEWRATRSAYLEKLQDRKASDAAFKDRLLGAARSATARWFQRVNKDSSRRAQLLEYKREYCRIQRAKINSDPGARQEKLVRQMDWYRSLSPADRERIFYEPRRKREFMSLILVRLQEAKVRRSSLSIINRAKGVAKARRWTQNEIMVLKQHYHHMSSRLLAKLMNRSATAVVAKAFKLGLQAKIGRNVGGHSPGRILRRWTAYEDDAVRKYYGAFTVHEIADALGRTLNAVTDRIRNPLKLSTPRASKIADLDGRCGSSRE